MCCLAEGFLHFEITTLPKEKTFFFCFNKCVYGTLENLGLHLDENSVGLKYFMCFFSEA